MMLRLKNLIGCLLLSSLVACGGGSGGGLERDPTTGGGTGNGGGGSGTTTERSIVLSLTDANGAASKELSSENPLTLNAVVKSAEGNVVNDVLVTFTFAPTGLADFTNDSGTATTGTTGTATIGLTVADNSGAGEIIATISSGETATITFNSAGITEQNEQPASLDFFASSLQLASSGKDKIELIALVKNTNNVVMKDVSVSFSVSNDASLSDIQSITSEDGTARAMLSTVNKPENRWVKVTATTGSANILVQSIDIEIIGTEIQIGGANSVILGDTAPLTIKVVDSDGVGIKNQLVNLSAVLGELSDLSPTTDNDGLITVIYTGSNAGEEKITATALNTSYTFELDVQEDDFTFTDLPTTDVPLGTPTTLTVTWKKGNAAYEGGMVTFKSSRGDVSAPQSVVTNAMGQASVTVQADNAGITSISADGLDAAGDAVSARTQFEFVAVNAASILVDATPDSIGPNAQTSTITAVVRDINDNLVKGKIINFRVEDVSGGTIATNSAVTDSKGLASTVFTSNAVSSNEFIRVHATVSDTPAVTNFTILTVADRPFDISIGTGRFIESADNSTYLKEFAVFVSDSDGNPRPDVNLTVSMSPVKFNQGGKFRKGKWEWDPENNIWIEKRIELDANGDVIYPGTTSCDNEDKNDNGILDSGEDTNGDTFLTPGIVGTVQLKGGGTTTDENGQATIQIRYPKAYGNWTDVVIKASGQSAGSEAAQSQKYTLPVAASDLIDVASPPPASPFGTSANCSNTN